MNRNSYAVWKRKHRGKVQYITGRWSYHWSADRFSIRLNPSKETRGIRNHDFSLGGDHPEWGDWKLVEDDEERIKVYTRRNRRELAERAKRIHEKLEDFRADRFTTCLPKYKSGLCFNPDCKICRWYYEGFIKG